MAHVLRYKQTITDDSPTVSPAASAITEEYTLDGRLVSFDKTTTIAGTYCDMTFATEADCDDYLAEMSAIGEETTSGSRRSDITRFDIEDEE